LDALRTLEAEGAIGPGKLYPAYYVIPGNQGSPAVMRRVGQEIATDLKKENVEGVLFVATLGTCSRSVAVISKELEKAGLPVALVSAMFPVALQVRANRIVKGVSIPHPCGDPSLPKELDARLRREIVQTALKALEAEVKGPTLFSPN